MFTHSNLQLGARRICDVAEFGPCDRLARLALGVESGWPSQMEIINWITTGWKFPASGLHVQTHSSSDVRGNIINIEAPLQPGHSMKSALIEISSFNESDQR